MEIKNVMLGFMLIAAGVILGLATLDIINGSILFYILTLGFIAGYIGSGRKLGLLIPGCVLGALALFVTFTEKLPNFSGLYFLIMLGAAFIAIFVIHTMHYNSGNWGEKYWPLFPGFSLVLLGAVVMAVENGVLEFDLNYLNLILPAGLMIVGVGMIAGQIRKKGMTK